MKSDASTRRTLPRRTLPRWSALLALVPAACGGSTQEAAPPPESPARAAVVEELAPLEPSKIIFAMGGIENDFRKCFFRNPRDRGTLRVRWQADTDGVAHDATIVESTLETPAIEECLLGRVNELRFGRLERPAHGEWVFVFRLATPPDPKLSKAGKKARKRSASDDEGEGISVDPNSPGWIEPHRVADIVEAGMGLFARCYRTGISRQEALAGNVRLQFVVGEDGRIQTISDQGSDLPDLYAVDCVAEGFYALKFPKPERGGPVTVSYRIRLN